MPTEDSGRECNSGYALLVLVSDFQSVLNKPVRWNRCTRTQPKLAKSQLTPQDQLRLQWQQQPGSIPLLRQKNVIDQNAELLPLCRRGWACRAGFLPALFALQGLVLIAFIAACLNWQMTRHSGQMEDEITALQSSSQTRDQAPGRNHCCHAGGDQKNFQFAQLDLQVAYVRNAAYAANRRLWR